MCNTGNVREVQCTPFTLTVLYCTVVTVLYCTGVFHCVQCKMPLRWAGSKNKIQFGAVLAYFALNCTVLYFSNTGSGANAQLLHGP